MAQNREHLWNTYLENNNENAFAELVESYLPLVRYIASRLNFKLPNHLSQEDLVSYGIFGLMEAVKKFDPQKGVKFETYASQRIRGSIIDSLRSEQWAPRSVTDKIKEYQQALKKFENMGKTDVSEKELVDEMNISVKDIRNLMIEINQMSVCSLEDFLHGSELEKMSLADTVSDTNSPNPVSGILEREFYSYLVKAVEELPEKDRTVISLYYYEELTLKEIGQILDVSESRISQLHARAVTRLRGILQKYLKSYGLGV